MIGGETAEMPGMYRRDDYDLAGFAVGIVEKKKIIDGSRIRVGDAVIGLASSGLHSNGFSLVRKVFNSRQIKALSRDLLRPTRIYVDEVLGAAARFSIKGMAHITGGAFYEKLTKVLPRGKCFRIRKGSWDVPPLFEKIQQQGRISDPEMFRTFNMGIGFCCVVLPEEADKARRFFKERGLRAYVIGEVVNRSQRKILL